MKTIKLTDREIKVLDNALDDYIYSYEENIEHTEKSIASKVLKNTKSARNILKKLKQ